MDVLFEIISRGKMRIKFGDKICYVSGELTFTPPVFYADINSLKNWDYPFENLSITEYEKKEIILHAGLYKNTKDTKIVLSEMILSLQFVSSRTEM